MARDMKSSFPCIQFVLTVGLGGGAPSHDIDIRLGDVVVGTAVVPYGFGKMTDTGFKITGNSKGTSRALCSKLSPLDELLQRGPRLQRSIDHAFGSSRVTGNVFRRPSQSKDRLCKSNYGHGHRCECLRPHGKGLTHIVKRKRRQEGNLVRVHYGNVASADQVMKNVRRRNELSWNNRIICFEMESISIMNNFDCLPIRGVCDYSDSHENDSWHGYAALAAAVYAKLLLSTIRPDEQYHGNLQVAQEEMERFVSDGFRGIKESVGQFTTRVDQLSDQMDLIAAILRGIDARLLLIEQYFQSSFTTLRSSEAFQEAESQLQGAEIDGRQNMKK
ncbi:nucleoside phosphorylase domain-containing protein [Aspergillus alliaceus]|uniref:nucleoside phosphorylase domain-containing protein n=1 Tax=Petromyces alliaceus TaxID=209559 RepID=UPI0012A76B60|nr:nucleoside phosphorylase domain-containing protein [Aspergillus alliaceus]KAB8235931.1 nucleoside phosphorylase domain-containing protein [Aspergillus alliaceus]